MPRQGKPSSPGGAFAYLTSKSVRPNETVLRLPGETVCLACCPQAIPLTAYALGAPIDADEAD
jgi:hypothetical protein